MKDLPLKKEKPRDEATVSLWLSIPSGKYLPQEYRATETILEEVVNIFKETARQPICDSLKHYCQAWYAKEKEISELERIILKLPVIKDGISLRGLYEVTLPYSQQELHEIERHIRRLQRCLEILEGKALFTKPADLPGHIDIESLKERIQIVDVISQYVELRKTGTTYKGRCPFHNERTPSFIAYPATRRWWCFGACSEGGDVLTFVQKIRNCNFREAVAELERI